MGLLRINNQSGDIVPFASGKNGQTAHFDDIDNSRFANIDPDHSSVKMKDEPLVFVENMSFRIGRGILTGLQDALGISELSSGAAALIAGLGITLAASTVILPAVVVSALGIIIGLIGIVSSAFTAVAAVGGIYSTAVGPGTSYDKAEAFAHDATMLVVSMIGIWGSVNAVKNSLAMYKSASQNLAGRETRLTASEVVQNSKSANLISSMDDFLDYTNGFLDEDALQYAKEVLGNDADDIAKLKKIAQLIEDGSKKIGGKLSKEELKAGLDAYWNDAGVEGDLAAIERVFKGDEYTIIWDKIVATAENMENTEIPATFQIELNVKIDYVNPETGTNVLWANANATEHMGEYVDRFGGASQSIGVRSQLMLESFRAALNKAMETMISNPPGRQKVEYGNWEFGINTKTGVIYHAKMLY